MHFFRAGMFFILSWKACNWVRFISVIAIGVCSNLMCLWKVPLAFTWLLGMLTSSPRLPRMWNVCAGRHIYRINLRSIQVQLMIVLVTSSKFTSSIWFAYTVTLKRKQSWEQQYWLIFVSSWWSDWKDLSSFLLVRTWENWRASLIGPFCCYSQV